MNETIKNLIVRAHDKAARMEHEFHSQGASASDFFPEILAELIVQECASSIENERQIHNPTEWDQGAEWGHKNSIDTIHKHFGVE